MSPLPSDRLELVLTPFGAGVRRVPRSRLVRRAALSLWADVDADGDLHWTAPLAALGRLLETPALRGATARVCLSNHFARCALMPASELVVTHDDALRFARHNFERVHGTAAAAWSVRASPLPGGALLASGVEQDLIDALRALLRARKLAPVALEPAVMTLHNAARATLPAGACRLVAVEPGLAVAALLAPHWRHVRTHRVPRAATTDLVPLIERERRLDDEPAAPVPTCVLPLVPLAAAPLPDGTRVFDPFWIPSAAVATETMLEAAA